MSSIYPGIKAVLESFFEERPYPAIVSVYMFGSHATERAHRESDIDLAVVLDRSLEVSPRDRIELRVQLGSDLIHALGRNEIDVLVLNEAPPLLARKIILEGRRVFCRDGEKDRCFRRDVQLRAADVEPFLDRYRQLKLDALAR